MLYIFFGVFPISQDTVRAMREVHINELESINRNTTNTAIRYLIGVVIKKIPDGSWESFELFKKNLKTLFIVKSMFSFQVLRPFLRLVINKSYYIDFKI